MTFSHSLKTDNKPLLFSFDIETEYKNIDQWLSENKRYAKRDLETEANLLRQITKDFIDIIETKVLTEKQLDNLVNAIELGGSGVWESATNKLELLSYHFENAKKRIIECMKTTSSNTVERMLNCISEHFTTTELVEIFTITFRNKSKKVKIKTANIALDLRKEELIPFLKDELSKQSDNKVLEVIQFAIDNMWQPKGELVF
ncbi:MAG: hypothetical protein ACOVP1_00780 [Bacteroidia bacterium]